METLYIEGIRKFTTTSLLSIDPFFFFFYLTPPPPPPLAPLMMTIKVSPKPKMKSFLFSPVRVHYYYFQSNPEIIIKLGFIHVPCRVKICNIGIIWKGIQDAYSKGAHKCWAVFAFVLEIGLRKQALKTVSVDLESIFVDIPRMSVQG